MLKRQVQLGQNLCRATQDHFLEVHRYPPAVTVSGHKMVSESPEGPNNPDNQERFPRNRQINTQKQNANVQKPVGSSLLDACLLPEARLSLEMVFADPLLRMPLDGEETFPLTVFANILCVLNSASSSMSQGPCRS